MKTERAIFWVSITITLAFLILAIVLYFCDFPISTLLQDISIGIFSGALLSVLNLFIQLIMARINAIRTIIFEVFQIKQLYGKIESSNSEREFFNGCKDTEVHFQRIDYAFSNLFWIPFHKNDFEKIKNQVFEYCKRIIGTFGALEDDTSFPYENEKAGICSLGEIELSEVLVTWKRICGNYISDKQLKEYLDCDKAFSKCKKTPAKTIDEIIENWKERRDNGPSEI